MVLIYRGTCGFVGTSRAPSPTLMGCGREPKAILRLGFPKTKNAFRGVQIARVAVAKRIAKGNVSRFNSNV